jgi:phosphoglycolate phosphatase
MVTDVYEHVAFDLDGTLVDSRADLAAAVNHVLQELGLAEIEVATVEGYVGEGARVLVQRAIGREREHLWERGLESFMSYYGAHLLDATRPYPGIVEALAALAGRGVALSVLTNKPVAMSRTIVDGLGLGPFVAVVGGDSMPARKPDPAGVDHLRGVTRTPHARFLLVGDSAIDVRTARAGKVACCGAGWGLSPESLRAARPDVILAQPGELIDVVERGVSPDQRVGGSHRTSS